MSRWYEIIKFVVLVIVLFDLFLFNIALFVGALLDDTNVYY